MFEFKNFDLGKFVHVKDDALGHPTNYITNGQNHVLAVLGVLKFSEL